MEIVSDLLGHCSIKTTEASYRKIVQKKITVEIKKLNNELDNK